MINLNEYINNTDTSEKVKIVEYSKGETTG